MKYYYSYIIIMLTCACTPQEAFIAQEVLHEASVAEQAIENDLRGASAPAPQPQNNNWTAPPPRPSQVQFKYANQRQYPPRHEKNRGFAGQNRGA